MLREYHGASQAGDGAAQPGAGAARRPSVPSPAGGLRAVQVRQGWLRLAGEADETTREIFETAVRGLSRCRGELHVDLGDLTFIDVAGVGSLVRLAANLGPEGRLVLHRPPAALRRILALLWPGLSTIQLADPERR